MVDQNQFARKGLYVYVHGVWRNQIFFMEVISILIAE